MLTKKSDRGAAGPGRAGRPNGGPPRLPNGTVARPQPAAGTISIIGTDLSITGDLESTGEVRIEGEVQGDIRANRIVVGEEATITGALTADEIIIGGTVQGSIRGNNVTFQTASRIEADVYHRSLAIEQGAYFEGKSRRSNDPMSVPPENPMTPSG